MITKPQSDKVQEIHVKDLNVRGGWLDFTIVAGEQRFETQFSSEFDPIKSLRKWLEALTTGVFQSSFYYNAEGREFIWQFTHDWREVFTVFDYYDESDSFIYCFANRKKTIENIYLAFLRFFSSDKYKPNEWEIEYLWERITKATNTTYEQTVDTFLEYDRQGLKELLYYRNPVYWSSYPQADYKKIEWNMFVKYMTRNNNLRYEIQQDGTPMDWIIPEEYDYLTREKKTDLIKEVLSGRSNCNSAEKPEVFRSKLIDDYLKKEERVI